MPRGRLLRSPARVWLTSHCLTGSAIQGQCEGSVFSSIVFFFNHPGHIKPSCPCSRGSGSAIRVAAESGAYRCLSVQRPNLLQRVLMMHLLMLNCPCPHRPPMGSGTALCRDLPQTPPALHGLRPYVAFPLHLRGLRVPAAGPGRGDTMRSVQGTLRSHGAGGYTNAKRYYFPWAEAEA